MSRRDLSANRKRKADSHGPTSTSRPKPKVPKAQIGTADTDTPLRPGSARRSKETLTDSRTSSRSASAAEPTNNPPAAPPKSTQLNMDDYLEDEMRGAIFCDPKFPENFLGIGEEWLQSVRAELQRIPKNIQRELKDSITAERDLYEPILGVLQSIKDAVDTVRAAHNLGALGTNFCDSHTTAIPGDDPDTHLIKPDLVLFESNDRNQHHWETLMMPIEVKAKHTYRKVGMKQLTRYARAVFAHQIHRRHLYGMVICKWAATFVRFDRCGIVHSEPIDMLHSPRTFREAFAGLMMMDRNAFGYDTAFSTERIPAGRLEYFVDLPAAAFPPDNTGSGVESPTSSTDSNADSTRQSSMRRQLPTRRFKVMERLCHRKSIQGRATIVLRLREVRKREEEPEPGSVSAHPMTRSRTQSQRGEPTWEEVPEGREYALKLMWRDPSKLQEGKILRHLVGEYGVAQCQWYSDVLEWDATCHGPEATSCGVCCDITPAQAVVRQVRNLRDLDIEVAPEKGEDEPQYVEVDTDDYVGELYTHRMARIYTWALLVTVGRLLWTAKSLRELLEAFLDGLLGYWQTFNNGLLHRDISDGNVLIAEPGPGYDQRKWKPDRGATVQEDGQPAIETENDQLAESKRLAQETIIQLGRDPIGFLSDYDLAATHGGMGSAIFGHTPTANGESYFQIPNTEHAIDIEPNAKRLRKDEDNAYVSSAPGASNAREEKKPEEFKSSPFKVSGHKSYRPIDFRTGTPTFMSIRVLLVELGTPYDHRFTDDLESFFWLIFWCVVQHVDRNSDDEGEGGDDEDEGGDDEDKGNDNEDEGDNDEDESGDGPTEKAVKLLHQLDRADSELESIANAKDALLRKCSDGGEEDATIVDILKDCENSWASNPAIVHVIVNMGTHLQWLYAKRVRLLQCTPEIEFPKFVGIITEGLKRL
ncbi:unnamed protein product [Rhizoctonia solani]|uniref:Fungal-type protein kinase domain-containing protein n=1 Tax=Rhizoctonia solani TaxID=456999 RepID=A0A8H3HP03_9AGAM|nr:unnamed protein product [Rhizoctonia solani]